MSELVVSITCHTIAVHTAVDVISHHINICHTHLHVVRPSLSIHRSWIMCCIASRCVVSCDIQIRICTFEGTCWRPVNWMCAFPLVCTSTNHDHILHQGFPYQEPLLADFLGVPFFRIISSLQHKSLARGWAKGVELLSTLCSRSRNGEIRGLDLSRLLL